MLTLFSECHFWTLRDEVHVDSTDYGAFRYERNRDAQQSDLVAQIKRAYIESRNGTAVLKNNSKEPGRLKDNIKKLEELLKAHRIVCAQWQDAAVVLLLFSNGVIAYICVDIYTGDILRMVFEKYFVGKLAAEVLSDAFFTRSHIVLAYNTNQLTVVHLQKSTERSQGPEKIIRMDPRIYHIVIPGPSERKLNRNLTVNSSFDLFVLWTKSSQNEVYPWRPTIRDQDRANINVFKLKGTHLESISYCWTENDPLCVDFLRSTESQIITVEQKVSSKGEVSAEICTYQINSGKMQRTNLLSIGLSNDISCLAFSPDQEKLFLGLNDRSLCLHDLVQNRTKFIKQIDIVPACCSWHSDSSIVMIANEQSQFQCFDLALTSIANQLQSEEFKPSAILNLAHYFTTESKLLKMLFSRKPDLTNYSLAYAQTDSFLLAIYENGPLCCLRFFGGTGMKGDIHNSGLTPDVLVDKYLGFNQLENAVNLLESLNWETYGAMCLISLHKIANYVFFRRESKGNKIELMTKAFKTFLNTVSEETKNEFSDQVFDLKRRFFFFLLRNSLYTDAFNIAQDIKDYDLFMDLFNLTKTNLSHQELSAASFNHAVRLLEGVEEVGDCQSANITNLDNSQLEYSRSSSPRSENKCAESNVHRQEHDISLSALKHYIPPLPSVKSNILSNEITLLNIPKSEAMNVATHERLHPISISAIDRSLEALLFTNSIVPNLLRHENLMQKRKVTPRGSRIQNNPKLILSTAEPQFLIPENVKSSNVLALGHFSECKVAIKTTANPPTDACISSPAFSKLPRASAANKPAVSVASSKQYRHNFTHQEKYQPKFYHHPLVSGTIPPTSNTEHYMQQDLRKNLQKKPSASILSNGTSQKEYITNGKNSDESTTAGCSKESGNKTTIGERNKVKFSDTVQVAVVPEIPRKEKLNSSKNNGYLRPPNRNLTNPKKELADSLPLCHPNDDYLKDFNPISKEDIPKASARVPAKEDQPSSDKLSSPSIKVVHFGVV